MKKSFTIIEMLIVVIIIGVLATMAAPQFLNSVEKTKVAKAKHNLALIFKAATMCEEDLYGGNGDYSNAKCSYPGNMQGYVGFQSGSDGDWTYSYVAGATTFTATADRDAGRYGTCVININQDQVFTSSGTCVQNAI